MNEKNIYIRMHGRMGNNLFQAATAHAMSLENDCDYFMVPDFTQILPEPDNCNYKHYLERFKNNIFRNLKFSDLNQHPITYSEPDFSYNKISFSNNMCINGYFQSHKYFNNYKNEIFKLFEIDEFTNNKINENYGELFNNETVSINIRRGDYLKLGNLYNVIPIEYYFECIKYFGNKTFIITSDDINWCNNNFKYDNCHVINQNDPLVDLYIQTKCNHNILSCSTFSWWGAWLNQNEDKKVIIPTPWFGPGFSYNTKDIYPEEWVKKEINKRVKENKMGIIEKQAENYDKYCTDKFKGGKYGNHMFNDFYEKLLNDKTNEDLKLLEIGIENGGSVRLFHDYLVNSEIIGVDIDERWSFGNITDYDRLIVKYFDGYDLSKWGELPFESYDIIIDDGPHTIESQIFALSNFSKKLNKGGHLIIEDVPQANLDKILNSSTCDMSKVNVHRWDHISGRWDDIIIEYVE